VAKVENEKYPVTAGGTVLTPEVVEELAEEAERGYDLSKATRVLLVGRPSLGDSGTSPRLSFRASPDLYEAIQERAKLEGRSVSDLAREALADYVGLE
jgi:hypothetical protein